MRSTNVDLPDPTELAEEIMYALEMNKLVSVFGLECTIEQANVHSAVSARLIDTLRPVNIVEPMDLESDVFNKTVNAIR